jgi:FkbM family methyltransferase
VRILDSLIRSLLRRLDRRLHTELAAGLRVAWGLPAKLSPSVPDRIRTLLAAILLSTLRMRRPVRLRVLGPAGPRWFVVPDWAALRALEEVFAFGEYDVDLPRAPRRILDLGSHVGASILFFALRYPDATIVGAEPSPSLFPILEANVGDLANVTLRQAAVGAVAGPVAFYEGTASWAGATAQRHGATADAAVLVEGVRLDDLLAEAPTDVVKLDIEGGEFDALPASRLIADVPVLLGEIHAPPGTPESERLLGLWPEHTIRLAPPEWSGGWFTVFSAVRGPGSR